MKNLKNRRLFGYVLGITTLANGPAGVVFAQNTGDQLLEEIVVTAQRREESLQNVPISVTALSGEILADASVTSNKDLAMVVPGLRIDSWGAGIQPTIRGIGSNILGAAASSNVATYVDGVYMPVMFGGIYELPDVEQIQVLKGPQGTLFGRNATGGAILIDSKDPNLEELQGQASISYGRYDQIIGKAHLSTPIVEDKLGFSITVLHDEMDGYLEDVTQGGKEIGSIESELVRAKLRFDPSDYASFLLSGTYSEREDYMGVKNTNYEGNSSALALLPISQIASEPWEYGGNEDPYAATKHWSLSLKGDLDLGPGTLSTTTGYTDDQGYLTSDADNAATPFVFIGIPYFLRSFQQEILYSTEQIGNLRGVGGFYYYKSEGAFNPLDINRQLQRIYTRDNTESYSAFGEVTLSLTDQIDLTGGLRYTSEDVDAKAGLVLGPGPDPTSLPQLGEESWDAVTPRASILYKPSDVTSVYFTYSRGFQSGLFNGGGFQSTPIDPEEVDAFEVGVKTNRFTDASISLAAFYYDYQDMQQPAYRVINGIPQQQVLNAASSEIYGVEFNGTWVLSNEFKLTTGLTFLEAEYDSFPGAVVLVPTGVGGNAQILTDVSGNTMLRSPEWSGNVTLNYSNSLSFGLLDASATVFYSSKYYVDVGNRVVQPDYTLLNASLGLQPIGTDVEVRVWGKNLTDEDVIFSQNLNPFGDAINYAPPRTYGVELKYTF